MRTLLAMLVTHGGAPAPGIDVVFSRADGAFIAHEKTGADGRVVAPSTEVGAVSIATHDEYLHSWELLTIFSIEPSDRIQVELMAYEGKPPTAPVAIVLPGAVAGATAYQVVVGGSDHWTSRPSTLSVPKDDRSRSIGARAIDRDRRTLAYTISSNHKSPEEVVLPPWQTTFKRVDVQVIDPPQEPFEVAIDLSDGGRFMRADIARFPFEPALRVPLEFSGSIELTLLADQGTRVSTELVHLDRELVIDARRLLPKFIDLDWERSERGASVHFGFDATPSDADGVWIGMSFGDESHRVNWTILAPPSAGTYPAIALPEALATWRPTSEPRLLIATLFDRASIPGPRFVRMHPTDSMRAAVQRAPWDPGLRFSQARKP